MEYFPLRLLRLFLQSSSLKTKYFPLLYDNVLRLIFSRSNQSINQEPCLVLLAQLADVSVVIAVVGLLSSDKAENSNLMDGFS